MLEVREERRKEVPGGDLGTLVLYAFPQLQTPPGTKVSTRLWHSPSTDTLEEARENWSRTPSCHPWSRSPICGANEGRWVFVSSVISKSELQQSHGDKECGRHGSLVWKRTAEDLKREKEKLQTSYILFHFSLNRQRRQRHYCCI